MSKIIIITGQTCSGKSQLALNLAQKYNGEIISADSVQVYKQLNIGSAKVSNAEQKLVKHHLINIKNFDENFNVDEFVTLCKIAINDIISRGKLPIIVGGTGLYIQALMSGYNLGTAGNPEFRQKMESLAKQKGNNYIWELLNKKNPTRANLVHPNNIKRVIRYLELEESPNINNQVSPLKDFAVLCVGIVNDRTVIYNKIEQRVDLMLDSGLESEVKNLIKIGATENMQSMSAIGYKEWFDYFNGTKTYQETINLIKQHTRNYCKRQETFMKTIKNIKLCTLQEAEECITNFLNK